MAEAARTVEAELRLEVVERADSLVGLSTLIDLLLEEPSVRESPEYRWFALALYRYVQLKRKRNRWYSRGYGDLGRYGVPTSADVTSARIDKNYALAKLRALMGTEAAMALQRKLGHQISSSGEQWFSRVS